MQCVRGVNIFCRPVLLSNMICFMFSVVYIYVKWDPLADNQPKKVLGPDYMSRAGPVSLARLAGLLQCVEMTFSPVLHEASQPG